jgi:CBS-domain-containing membrane protein
MTVMTKPFLSLTAADLMSAAVVTLAPDLALREAARLLAQQEISGAPVVDEAGRCVGMLAATDFIHWAERGGCAATPRCTMPPGDGYDWRVMDLEMLPTEKVRAYMTADPVTVESSMGIRELARLMFDGHIHRVGVVDEQNRLVGIVSSTDVLAAVAYADGEQ